MGIRSLVVAEIIFVLCALVFPGDCYEFYNSSAELTDGSNSQDIGYPLSPTARNYRKSKFFPLFTIIRFTNEVCRTTSEENGICYTRSQCSSSGGSAQGSCAQGLGVCCKFVADCGGVVTQNGTSFQNPNFPSKYTPAGGSEVCQIRIRKANNVCQLRLNFIAFDIDGPMATATSTTAMNLEAGVCKTDSLAITSSGATVPSLCGNLIGQHVYVNFGSSDTITLNLLLSGSTPKERTWNIEILMIPCNSQSRAPVGCLQYFTGVTGEVKSFNFQGGVHLANQDYSACIRMEDGMRSIDWSACNPGDVKIIGGATVPPPATSPAVPPVCQAPDVLVDYLIIMGGIIFPQATPTGTTAPPAPTSLGDRFCDNTFSLPTSFVRSTVRPFILHFKTDGTERTNTAATTPSPDGLLGFCLKWQQSPL